MARKTRKGTAETKEKELFPDEAEKQEVVLMVPDLSYPLGHQEIPVPEEMDITPFITNEHGHVYAITNLPEEFIAVLFAWVSRSPLSFKESLRKALEEGHIEGISTPALQHLSEKAKAFHEKWTIGYGHSSCAEHAIAHVGIERISRLASAELELSNTFLSITEYSQRYQKPQRGDWHNPFDFDAEHDQWEKFNNFMHKCYGVFETLIDAVLGYLVTDYAKTHEGNQPNPKELEAMKKLAFEDARYALPLAMWTQLGMTANGRAWRDGIVELKNSKYNECQELAENVATEISKVLPTLLKYTDRSVYKERSAKRMKKYFNKPVDYAETQGVARLMGAEPEEEAITKILTKLMMKHENLNERSARFKAQMYRTSLREEIIKDLLFEIGAHDMPPEEFKAITYEAEFLISEANWHQLLRHNRKTDFSYGRPTPYMGITVPPRIQQAGFAHLLQDLAEESKQFYNELREEGSGAEDYVVLNAHRRCVTAHFSLWEAYHLINLRTSEHAQWDIRHAFEELYRQLMTVHPLLIGPAKRRG